MFVLVMVAKPAPHVQVIVVLALLLVHLAQPEALAAPVAEQYKQIAPVAYPLLLVMELLVTADHAAVEERFYAIQLAAEQILCLQITENLAIPVLVRAEELSPVEEVLPAFHLTQLQLIMAQVSDAVPVNLEIAQALAS